MIFILIDDDPVSNLIHKRVIKNTYKNTNPDFICFTNPVKALDFVTNLEAPFMKENKIIIFLDLNMPLVNGWEFLERIKDLPGALFTLYILSSSIDKADVEKSKTYSFVKGYFYKPLYIQKIEEHIKEEPIF